MGSCLVDRRTICLNLFFTISVFPMYIFNFCFKSCFFFRLMSEQGEYNGPYREQGRPLGTPESPLIDFSEGERVERHLPLNYDLLNEVEGEVTSPSPRTKALKDFAAVVEQQKLEFKRMLADATKAMSASRAETTQAIRERDEARRGAARPPSRAVPIPASQGGFNFGSFVNSPPGPSSHSLPHHPPPVAPPPGFGQFLSTRGTVLSHEELSHKVKRYKEAEEEKKRETQLSNPGHLHINQELVDVQSSWVRVQSALDRFHGEGNVPVCIQSAMDQGENQLMLARQGLRIIESYGPKLAAQFHRDPLLTTEDTALLRSLVKDQKDKNAMRGNGGGGCTPGVRGGRVGGAPKATAKKAGASGKSVSGSSQLIASSVSSGLVSNVAKVATLKRTARSREITMFPTVVLPSSSILPPALQAGVSAYFNDKITDIQLLDKFEGGMVTEDDDGLAIMFEADSEIESKLTGTLKSRLCLGAHWCWGVCFVCHKKWVHPKIG